MEPAVRTGLPTSLATRRRWWPHSTPDQNWAGFLFIAPNVLGFLVFTLLPLLFAFGVSFARWDVISGFEGVASVGLQQLAAILRDKNLHEAAGRTLIYVGASVPLTLIFGLLLAMALNTRIPGRALLRTIFFIPFIANAVAISATWVLLYHPRFGPINAALRALGVAEPPLWLGVVGLGAGALIVMAIWAQLGYRRDLLSGRAAGRAES